MARPAKSFPSYRKHRASGQAVVTIGARDFYLGPHGTDVSKREYDRLVMEWVAAGRNNSFGTPESTLSIAELLVDYIKHCRIHYGTGPKSTTAKIIIILRTLNAMYGDTAAAEFGVQEYKAVREKFIQAGHSRRYINDEMAEVTRFFRWAVAEGKIPAQVVQTLQLIPGLRRGKSEARETDPVTPVSDAIVDVTLPHLPAVVSAMVRLQRLTGARPAEIGALRPIDIDRSAAVWLYRPTHHKTAHRGRERVIFIGPRAQEVLQSFLDRDPESFCFRPVDSESLRRAAASLNRKTPKGQGNSPGSNRKPSPQRQPGQRYSVDSYRRAIHRVCKSQDIPHWSPNQLRHQHATEVRKQFGLEAAQIALGHSTANVTQIYAERDLGKGVEVAKLIG